MPINADFTKINFVKADQQVYKKWTFRPRYPKGTKKTMFLFVWYTD